MVSDKAFQRMGPHWGSTEYHWNPIGLPWVFPWGSRGCPWVPGGAAWGRMACLGSHEAVSFTMLHDGSYKGWGGDGGVRHGESIQQGLRA